MAKVLALSQVQFGSQAFFDEFKKMLNEDAEFRKSGSEVHYTATETVVVSEVSLAYFQSTKKGFVEDLRVVSQDELPSIRQKSDLVYQIPEFETMLKLCRGETSAMNLVLGGKMQVKGNTQTALKFYSCINRAMKILASLCASDRVSMPKNAAEYR